MPNPIEWMVEGHRKANCVRQPDLPRPMGIGRSALKAQSQKKLREENLNSRQFDRAFATAKDTDEQIVKLLLLGTGDSGKTTICKQIRKLYGTPMKREERLFYAPVIVNFICGSMNELCVASDALEDSLDTRVRPGPAIDAKEFFLRGKFDVRLEPNVVRMIRDLWADQGIRNTINNRSKFQYCDSIAYFVKQRLDDITQPDYLPNQNDILRVRVPTTAIVESDFVMENQQFKILDVGGQRTERKKWMHCFEGVTAVIFVTSIAEYDQVLYEDPTMNRMLESIQLFHTTVNTPYFKNVSIILFLNKVDLFQDKIKSVPLKTLFNDYCDGDDSKAAIKFIKHQFLSQVQHDAKRVYVYTTCATDVDHVRTVFVTVRSIILMEGLSNAKLV